MKQLIFNIINTLFTFAWIAGIILITHFFGWGTCLVYLAITFLSMIWGGMIAAKEHLPGSNYYERNHSDIQERLSDIQDSLSEYIFNKTNTEK